MVRQLGFHGLHDRTSCSGLDTCGTEVRQQNRMGVGCSLGGVSESDPVEPLKPKPYTDPGFELPLEKDRDPDLET